jgi:hypothetical protein
VSSEPESTDPEKLQEEIHKSIEKARKMVEEHEKEKPKADAEPPLFYRQD